MTPKQSDHAPYSVIALCVAVLAILASIVIQRFFGALSSLPGSRLSKITSLPLRLATILGNRHTHVHSLHRRYGPVVRLAPNEVSIIDTAAVKQMYKMGSKFCKSPWYLDFTSNTDSAVLFATLNDVDHAQLRRLVANRFAEKSIRADFEPDIAAHTKFAVQKMAEELKANGFVDVFKWFVFMANDVICRASFIDTFDLVAGGKKTDLVSDILSISRTSMIRTQSPTLSSILALLSPSRFPSPARTVSRLMEKSSLSLSRYESHLSSSSSSSAPPQPTLLSRMFSSAEDQSSLLSRDRLTLEGVSYIIAGTETTAVTATYVVWHLALRPELERAVRDEVANLLPPEEDFGCDELAKLKTLNACIDETLRLRTPVSQGLPRVVPEGGLRVGTAGRGGEGGWFVPAGTAIGAPAWDLHRKEEVWGEDAEEFRPGRWEGATAEMSGSFFPWGGGSRVCLGIHIAYMELRYVLANFYRTFDKGVMPAIGREGFDMDEMETKSYFVLLPQGKKCLVRSR